MKFDLAKVLAPVAICATIAATPAFAQQPPPAGHEQHEAAAETGTNNLGVTDAGTPTGAARMDMGAMQGGKPPPDARDPDAYSGGFTYTDMPGQEQTDRLPVRGTLIEQLELVPEGGGDATAWDLQTWYGPDERKLWVRTEGAATRDGVDSETSAEVLRWRPFSPFWATQLGLRQDFGPGAHTYAAFGVQGLAPYWFEVEATAYVAEGGRFAARLKASYDLLFTNRLILTPKVESNFYSKAEPRRDLGNGAADVEIGLRLRYEIGRKLAPYVGVVWVRALGDTADLIRAEGGDSRDTQVVAGVRMLR